jgi:heme-degrading monooxygenase HmoA
MIMRTWRACTAEADGDAYFEYMQKAGLPRVRHGKAEFLVLSLWDSMESIGAFAGPDPTRAVFNPDDEGYLLEYDVAVRLYDVLEAPAALASAK